MELVTGLTYLLLVITVDLSLLADLSSARD